jgi:hypothetical protein
MLELQWGMVTARRCAGRRGKSGADSIVAREALWRAALLAGDVEGYAGACLDLGFDARVADDPGEDEGRGVEGDVTVPDLRDDRWIAGAVLRDREEIDAGGGGICRTR